MDAMREMILVLEHTQENPIMVDEEEMAVEGSESSKELEIEENEVVVPIPVLGRLIPIEEAVQELLDELVGTVRICDPTTQSRSRAEPEDPICSLYLSLLCFRPVPAPHPDFSPPYYISLYITSSLPFTR